MHIHLQGDPNLASHLSNNGLGHRIRGIALLAVHLDHRTLGKVEGKQNRDDVRPV